MYPFEFWCEQNNRMEFHWDNWRAFREELFRQYPTPPDKFRAELLLSFPSDRLEDVPTFNWNPHHGAGNYHLSNYDFFYDNAEWSTIFEVYPGRQTLTGDDVRLFAEHLHNDPWGERLRIMSTASDIHDQTSHRFAHFRGKFWKIMDFRQHLAANWLDFFFEELRIRRAAIDLYRQAVDIRAATQPVIPYPWNIEFADCETFEPVDWVSEGF